MKLYYMPGACSLADHIALQWTGAPFEVTQMSRESIKSPEYLAINAGGNVPLLQHDDLTLTENVAILGYIADLFPEAGLLGDGTLRSRAEVMRWLAFLNSDVHKAFKPIFTPHRILPRDDMVGELAATARQQVRTLLERLDDQLEGRDWLADARSIADPYLFVILRWAIALDVDLDGLDNLARFFERMHRDEGVRAALIVEEGVAPAP